jgi:hypothetical protein
VVSTQRMQVEQRVDPFSQRRERVVADVEICQPRQGAQVGRKGLETKSTQLQVLVSDSNSI